LADLQAEGRLFDSEPFCCAGEMKLLGNRDEIAEMPEFHGPTTGLGTLGRLRCHCEKPALMISYCTTVSSGWSTAGTTPAIASVTYMLKVMAFVLAGQFNCTRRMLPD
jgi:hypothetical protein